MKDNERKYIIWQNRAYTFYLAARLLNMKGIYGPATFCAIQTIELLLKATLIYWDKSFKPEIAGHKISKMIKTIKNKVPNGKVIDIVPYFYSDKRYQSVSRYPAVGKGIGIPGTFINDLDNVFLKLVILVPFQFNSRLSQALQGYNKAELDILRKANNSMRALRRHIGPQILGTA